LNCIEPKRQPPPLTKLHHAAFDAHLIGIDPDFRIHVSDRLLEIHDDPFLELGLKGIAGTLIDRARRLEDRPDRAIRHNRLPKLLVGIHDDASGIEQARLG